MIPRLPWWIRRFSPFQRAYERGCAAGRLEVVERVLMDPMAFVRGVTRTRSMIRDLLERATRVVTLALLLGTALGITACAPRPTPVRERPVLVRHAPRDTLRLAHWRPARHSMPFWENGGRGLVGR